MVHLFSIYCYPLTLQSTVSRHAEVYIRSRFSFKKYGMHSLRNFNLWGVTWTIFFWTVNFRLVSFYFLGIKSLILVPPVNVSLFPIWLTLDRWSDTSLFSSRISCIEVRQIQHQKADYRRSRKQTNLRFCCLEFFKHFKWSKCKGGRFTNTFHKKANPLISD